MFKKGDIVKFSKTKTSVIKVGRHYLIAESFSKYVRIDSSCEGYQECFKLHEVKNGKVCSAEIVVTHDWWTCDVKEKDMVKVGEAEINHSVKIF